MAKLTNAKKKKIIADYVETQSYTRTAKMNGVSIESVRRVVKADVDFVKKSEEKKLQDTQTTLEYMQTQHETKKHILDKILKAIEKKTQEDTENLNIKDLATAYGIILDKELKLLELTRANETTVNNGIINDLIGALNNAKKSE